MDRHRMGSANKLCGCVPEGCREGNSGATKQPEHSENIRGNMNFSFDRYLFVIEGATIRTGQLSETIQSTTRPNRNGLEVATVSPTVLATAGHKRRVMDGFGNVGSFGECGAEMLEQGPMTDKHGNTQQSQIDMARLHSKQCPRRRPENAMAVWSGANGKVMLQKARIHGSCHRLFNQTGQVFRAGMSHGFQTFSFDGLQKRRMCQ